MTTFQMAGSGSSPVVVDVTGNFTEGWPNSTYADFFTWTIPTTGYWIVVLQFNYDNGASQSDLSGRWVDPNGGITAEVPHLGSNRNGTVQAARAVIWGAGGILKFQLWSGGGPHVSRHGCTATFVPTPDYRI